MFPLFPRLVDGQLTPFDNMVQAPENPSQGFQDWPKHLSLFSRGIERARSLWQSIPRERDLVTGESLGCSVAAMTKWLAYLRTKNSERYI